VKYVVFLGDGMGDYAYEALDGHTPLQAARTPHMDSLAARGLLGTVRTIPEGMAPGSDVGNLSALGYDPRRFYTGRAPIEAASLGLELGPRDVAVRCNLVRLAERDGQPVMADYSAGHIDSNEARALIERLQGELGTEALRFHPGVSYRHILAWEDGVAVEDCTPPHDILGQPIDDYLPKGAGSDLLRDLMHRARALLDHPQANAIWLWGCGTMPELPPFRECFGVPGAVISAVDLVKGLGALAGLKVLEVEGATGYLDTNYAGKVAAALEVLQERDFVYVHVEAPDETGHEGRLEKKIQALEEFDANIVGPILDALPRFGPHAALLLPDHYTPACVRTHTPEPVPFALYRSDALQAHDRGFSEPEAAGTGLALNEGHRLMARFLEVVRA